MNDKFKTIFENLKKQGKLFNEYRDWNDYLERTRPAQEGKDIEESITNQAIKNEQEPPRDSFENSLSSEEKEQFNKMFNS
jgi:hypothetical protein